MIKMRRVYFFSCSVHPVGAVRSGPAPTGVVGRGEAGRGDLPSADSVTRASGSQSREAGFESCAFVFKSCASSFALCPSSSFSCMHEYLVIDSTGYLRTNKFVC